jgi:hypothetical protein
MTVVAPYSTSIGQRVPYITLAEFQAAPTGIDLTQLVPYGTEYNQETAVMELIGRASSIMDSYCFGSNGSLCATVNVENQGVTATRQGTYPIHPRFWPILAVMSASVGSSPGLLQNVPLTASNCWIEEQMFTITPGFGTWTSQGPLQFSYAGAPGATVFAVYSYVNGWPNTLTTASVAAGAQAINLSVLTGIYPGTNLTIYDAPYDEAVMVASDYVVSTNPVPLISPLQYNHATGISVSSLPPSIKQACILITSALIKTRGGGSNIVLSETGGGSESVEKDMFDRVGDLAWAAEILDSFRAVVATY